MRLCELRDDLFPDDFIDSSFSINGIPNENNQGHTITTVKQAFQNFVNWFGNSEAVDSSGRPVVFFHGTKSDFDEFKIGLKTTNSTTFGHYETTRSAIFVTPDVAFAHDYADNVAGSTIITVYAKAEKPFDMRNGITTNMEDELSSAGYNTRYIHYLQHYWEVFDGEEGDVFVSTLKQLGYDSVIFEETSPHTEVDSFIYALFSGNQLKSVYNRGTYKNSQKISENLKNKTFRTR